MSVAEDFAAYRKVMAEHIEKLEQENAALRRDVYQCPPTSENDYEGFKWNDACEELERENAELNRKLDQILTNKDYEGGVQFWIKKHDAVLLREASLLAENAALRADKERLDYMEKNVDFVSWMYYGKPHSWDFRKKIDAKRKEAQP